MVKLDLIESYYSSAVDAIRIEIIKSMEDKMLTIFTFAKKPYYYEDKGLRLNDELEGVAKIPINAITVTTDGKILVCLGFSNKFSEPTDDFIGETYLGIYRELKKELRETFSENMSCK